jgi:3-oxoacid CoA-transferase A subunit
VVEVLSSAQAAARVKAGDVVMVGGFGQVGAPLSLIAALVEAPDAEGLTIVSNNFGDPGRGLGNLLRAGRIRRAVGSYFTSNPDAIRAYEAGALEVELLQQGTLAEAIRAGGAGIGAFYVRTGVGTRLAEGCEEREIDGEAFLLQHALHADVAPRDRVVERRQLLVRPGEQVGSVVTQGDRPGHGRAGRGRDALGDGFGDGKSARLRLWISYDN